MTFSNRGRALAAGAVLVTCGAVACQAFLDTGADAAKSGLDGGPTQNDAAADGTTPEPSDGAKDAPFGRPPGLTTIAMADELAEHVAASADAIYYWSAKNHEIRRAAKNASPASETWVARPGVDVTGIVVEGTTLYWSENSNGDDGALGGHVIRYVNGVATEVFAAVGDAGVANLSGLALGGLLVTGVGLRATYTAEKNAAAVIPAEGQMGEPANGFSVRDDEAFFGFSDTIYRNLLPPSRLDTAERVVFGLTNFRDILVDGSHLFFFSNLAGLGHLVDCPSGLKGTSVNEQGICSELTTTDVGAHTLVASLGKLYWAFDGDGGSIMALERTNPPALPLVSDAGAVASLAADQDGVYWTTETGELKWLPKR